MKNRIVLWIFCFLTLIASTVFGNMTENSRQGSEDNFPGFRPEWITGDQEQHRVSRDVPEKAASRSGACEEKDLDDYLDRCDGGRGFENTGFDPVWFGRHHGRNLTPYLFAGRRYEPFTKSYWNRNRFYSPRYGRFLTKDPIGFKGDLNLYRYCQNNPVIFTDPSGMRLISPTHNNEIYVKAIKLLQQTGVGQKYLYLMEKLDFDIHVEISDEIGYGSEIGEKAIQRGYNITGLPPSTLKDVTLANQALMKCTGKNGYDGVKELIDSKTWVGANSQLKIFLGSKNKTYILKKFVPERDEIFVAHELLHEGLHGIDVGVDPNGSVQDGGIFKHSVNYEIQQQFRDAMFQSDPYNYYIQTPFMDSFRESWGVKKPLPSDF